MPRLPEPGGIHDGGLEPDSLRWNPSSATCQLCDLDQVSLPLCASVSSSLHWNDKMTCPIEFFVRIKQL